MSKASHGAVYENPGHKWLLVHSGPQRLLTQDMMERGEEATISGKLEHRCQSLVQSTQPSGPYFFSSQSFAFLK